MELRLATLTAPLCRGRPARRSRTRTG
jgi:hypothetical protein